MMQRGWRFSEEENVPMDTLIFWAFALMFASVAILLGLKGVGSSRPHPSAPDPRRERRQKVLVGASLVAAGLALHFAFTVFPVLPKLLQVLDDAITGGLCGFIVIAFLALITDLVVSRAHAKRPTDHTNASSD
jgi:hypothetical protein